MYMLTNHTNKVLYVGVTTKPIKRTWQHKTKQADGFSKKYKLYKLVYYELYDDIESALNREKQIKRWSRKKKEALINQKNPMWNDLFEEIID